MAAAEIQVVSPVQIDKQLDTILLEIANGYSNESLKRDIEFTKKTLGGEFLKFPDNDIRPCLEELRIQGRITPQKTGFLEYYAKDNKSIIDKIKIIKSQSTKGRENDGEFVGREEDIRAIVDSLTRRKTSLMALHGDPGVGKTTLADKIADLLQVNGQVRFKKKVNLLKKKSTFEVCRAILETLDPQKVLQPCIEFVYETIENLEKNTILIFDNAEELLTQPPPQENQLSFSEFLKGMVEHNKRSKLTILLTSRVPLPDDKNGYINYHVQPLKEASSATVLEKPNISLSPAEKNEIIKLCKNNPLLLQLVSASIQENLINNNNIKDWEKVLITLEKGGRLTEDEQAKYADNYNRNILNELFQTFTPELKKATIKLSLFQGAFTAKDAVKMIKQRKEETVFYLNTLRDRNFLQERSDKRHMTYEMHPEINEFMMKKCQEKENKDIFTDAKEIFFKNYLEKSKKIAQLLEKDYVRAYSFIEKERLNLKLAIEISFEMGFLYFSSDYSESTIIADLFLVLIPGPERLRLFRQWSLTAEEKGEWICYTILECMQIQVLLEKTTGKAEARELVRKVEGVLNKLNDKSSEAYLLAKSSFLYAKGEMMDSDCGTKQPSVWQQDEGKEVLEFYQRSLEIRQELLKDHTDTARTLNAIGNCYMNMNKHEKALEHYTGALEMRQRLSGSQEHVDMPVYINQIGVTHELLGKKYKRKAQDANLYYRKALNEKYRKEFNEALKRYQEALDLEKKLHISGYKNTATFYRNMSNAYSYLEEYELSLNTAKKALSVRKKLLGIDSDTIRSYYQVGLTYEKLDEIEKALKYFYKAYMMERTLPEGERTQVGDRVRQKIKSNLGSTEEAETYDKAHKKALQKGSLDDEYLTSEEEKEENEEKEEGEDDYHSNIQLSQSDDSSSELEKEDDETLLKVPPGTTVQTTDQVPLDANVQTADQVPLGANVHTTDQVPLGANVQTADQVPLDANVQTADQVPLGANVQTADQVPPGTTVQTADQVPLGANVQTADQVPLGANVQTADQVPPGNNQKEKGLLDKEMAIDIEESSMVESQTVGVRGLTWDIKETGVCILFLPATVQSDTSISCHANIEPDNQLPLEPEELLVSRVVRLEADDYVFDKEIGLLIPHCGASHTKGYEVVVKEFSERSRSWEEVDDFINIQHKSDLQDLDSEFATRLKDVHLPAVLLSRQTCSTVCITCRLVKETLLARPAGSTFVSSVFPEVRLSFERNTVKKNTSISMKVHPLPDFTVFNSPNFSCGPILNLQTSNSEAIDIHKPVKIVLPHPLAWYDRYLAGSIAHGQVRVLYNKHSHYSSIEWQDITDNPATNVSVHGQTISLQVRHFSMFWLIWLSDVKQDFKKLLNNAKEQFATLCRSTPFKAVFRVECEPRVRKGQAILQYTVVPKHMVKLKKSGSRLDDSDDDLYDGEAIQLELIGPIQRHGDAPTNDSMFCIKFSSEVRKQKSMNVVVEEEDGMFSCRFLRVLANNKELCDYPFSLQSVPEGKELMPLEFYGVPLEDPDNKWKLLETPEDVFRAMLSNSCLHKAANEACVIKSDGERARFFYQSVSHTDLQQEAFSFLVSNLPEASVHVKRVLQIGKKVVEKLLDKKTAKHLSQYIKEDYTKLAQVADLSQKCENVKAMKGNSKEKCLFFLQTWIVRKPPTLHLLMQKLREVGCEKGMGALLEHFEDCMQTERTRDIETSAISSDSTTMTLEGRYEEASSSLEPSLAGPRVSDIERTTSVQANESKHFPTVVGSGDTVQSSHGSAVVETVTGDVDRPPGHFIDQSNMGEIVSVASSDRDAVGRDSMVGNINDSTTCDATSSDATSSDATSSDDATLIDAVEGSSDESFEGDRVSGDGSETEYNTSLLYPGLCVIGLALCFIYFRYTRR